MVLGVPCEITLPLHDDGLVPLSLGGQSLLLNVDSALPETFAVYGDWYEKKYGPGACDQLPSGCYFCPDPRLCDDVYKRHRWKIFFAHGRENVTVVAHEDTLGIGNVTLPSFTFGLVIGYDSVLPDSHPDGLLGLSFPRPTVPLSLLQQLEDAHIVDDLAFSILPAHGHGFCGTLVLGTSDAGSSRSGRVNRARFVPPRDGELRQFLVDLVRVTIVKPEGGILTVGRIRSAASSSKPVALFDTGDDCIQIPSSDLAVIIEETNDCYMKKSNNNVRRRSATRSIWRDSEIDHWLIREDAIDCLPSLKYRLGNSDHGLLSVIIKPEHYTSLCDEDGCILHLRDGKESDVLVLGYPFFAAHESFFNLSGGWIDIVQM
ncbi:hypothetical protein FOL47_004761 [Perkinsus chesapeaki]|uniref:Peptidase A1 domain-containing protein n=1 Tax=Perkinsus chesapeaki TaxID=330153 RepID=A0A7J6MZQ1_PERCH|nr:hypothetical protein FOL47_004761 [Perkinsus chesapeaki]